MCVEGGGQTVSCVCVCVCVSNIILLEWCVRWMDPKPSLQYSPVSLYLLLCVVYVCVLYVYIQARDVHTHTCIVFECFLCGKR